jgi:hypothetical protein
MHSNNGDNNVAIGALAGVAVKAGSNNIWWATRASAAFSSPTWQMTRG